MTPVEWTPEDLVFSRQLDADHRKLFTELETVRQASEIGTGASPLALHLWRLSKDLSIHFASEERLMRESGYPARSWHKRQHQAGRKKMARLLEASRGTRGEERNAALQSFAHWLKDHVHLADRMLAAYLRNEQRGRLVS
jgi:hemerythrin